jgi:MinD-like ATPase involved in chromosome partitioning or flagellar assembly
MSICAIWGAPQSGKSTLAVNLAYALSRGDKSVCLISPVAYSELSAFLSVKIPEENSLSAALRGGAPLRQTVLKVDELFYVLAAPSVASALDGDYSGEQVKTLLELARLTFDIVLVDCLSETNDRFSAWALNRSDKVFLCVGGHVSGVLWHRANKKALQAAQSKTVYVGSEVIPGIDYAAMYKLLECTPEIRIPYIREASLFQNERRFLFGLSGKKGRIYAGAINKLYEAVNP